MPSIDLAPFVDRVAALVDSSPPTDGRETRTWLVEPFLEALGWDPRADACVVERTVDDTHLEYVPTIDSVPALFVAVEAYDESLEKPRANALRQAMAWTGVDRAIYTNGREYLLLAGTTDIEYHVLEVAELADSQQVIATYSRDACSRRLEQHARDHVARQLAVERSQLIESIVDRLTAATVQGEIYAGEFESATDRFLDRLVVAFAKNREERPDSATDVAIRFDESTITDDGRSPTTDGKTSGRSGENGDARRTDDPVETGEPNSSGRKDDEEQRNGTRFQQTEGEAEPTAADEQSGSDSRDDDSSGTAGDTDLEGRPEGKENEAGEGTETEPDEGGEYIVRFFNDRGSIGAIGHSTSRGALVEATEYLLGRGLAGVEVPWSPDDATVTVLNDEPARSDGSPMAEPERLSNGLYLDTAGDDDDRADRVEALSARVGLRAMVSGGWDSED
ncbi:hypothetical protein [Natrinema halophilum]|uniref:Restriction endonuclease n=1 Tax=Natrinema halophilum TaxID=1699371 RepID=A0A7D5KYD8_9EURY|nr:hypothetical protein [Natrinema halophilum]QLG50542.1 hypothetical protein HYG82_17675 [Natrinema halophilum]